MRTLSRLVKVLLVLVPLGLFSAVQSSDLAFESPWLKFRADDPGRTLDCCVVVAPREGGASVLVGLADRVVVLHGASGERVGEHRVEPLAYASAWSRGGGELVRRGAVGASVGAPLVVESWAHAGRAWRVELGTWTYGGSDLVWLQPAVGQGDVLICGDGDGGLAGLSITDGRRLWHRPRELPLLVASFFACPRACRVGSDLVVVECLGVTWGKLGKDGTAGQRLDFIRPQTGEVVGEPWHHPGWRWVAGLGNGSIGVLESDGLRVEPVERQGWIGSLPGEGSGARRVLEDMRSLLTVAGNGAHTRLVGLLDEGALGCFDPTTMRCMWTCSVGGSARQHGAPSIVAADLGDAVLMARGPESVSGPEAAATGFSLVDLGTGALRWSAMVPGVALGEAVRCDDAVVALTADVEKDAVTVTSFGMRDGAVRWTRTVPVKAEAAGPQG